MTPTLITLHTSYSGVQNKKSDLKKSEQIAKQFDARVAFISDKTVGLEIVDVDGFRRAMRDAKIDYLLD